MNIPVAVRVSGNNANFLNINPLANSKILQAMGARMIFLARQNFGTSGTDRPEPWQKLSRSYANRVKRKQATLYKSGAMYRSFRLGIPSSQSITVTCEAPYSSFHQDGGYHMPRRAFFPLTSAFGDLTDRARRQLETVAVLEIQKIIRDAQSYYAKK